MRGRMEWNDLLSIRWLHLPTQNAVGCDSTVTLLLTINNPTSSTTSISACNDYAWNGVTYRVVPIPTRHKMPMDVIAQRP